MKKLFAVLTVMAVTAASALTTGAADKEEISSDEFGVFTAIAGDGTTYVNLFEVILSDEYEDYWVEKCAEAVGDEAADETAEMLRSYISRDIYGQEAIDAYAADPDQMGFDCGYINDAGSFEFKDDTITTTGIDGTSQTHTYEYLGEYKIGEGETMTYNGTEIDPSFMCDVYKSTDDAGEFTYFLLRDDTMETTYHIEFRYGSDLEQLQKYMTGDYAYWLGAGIDQDADEETIHDVIDLFITENIA